MLDAAFSHESCPIAASGSSVVSALSDRSSEVSAGKVCRPESRCSCSDGAFSSRSASWPLTALTSSPDTYLVMETASRSPEGCLDFFFFAFFLARAAKPRSADCNEIAARLVASWSSKSSATSSLKSTRFIDGRWAAATARSWSVGRLSSRSARGSAVTVNSPLASSCEAKAPGAEGCARWTTAAAGHPSGPGMPCCVREDIPSAHSSRTNALWTNALEVKRRVSRGP